MDVRIVLLPDKKGEELSKKYSTELNQSFSCLFELGKGPISHMTLLHIQINESDFENLKVKLEEIVKKTKAILVSFDDLMHGTGDIANIGVYKEDEVVIELRDAIRAAVKKYIISLSPYYVPHVTLTKLQKESDVGKAVESLKNYSKTEITFEKIAVCENGPHGTCEKILASYDLKS